MKLTAKKAMQHLIAEGLSPYAIAKQLEISGNMIAHYLAGSRMRQPIAMRCKREFGIDITDIFNPTKDALEKKDGDSKNRR